MKSAFRTFFSCRVFAYLLHLFRSLLSKLNESGPLKPYYYVSFRWFTPVNLQDVARDLMTLFGVEEIYGLETGFFTMDEFPFSERERVRIRADTLVARLSPFRAVLFQRKLEPFTERDMELRKKILGLYPRHRPTMGYRKEPPFLSNHQESKALDP